MQKTNRLFIFTIVSFFFFQGIYAQTRISSPYSVYGIGEISSNVNSKYFSMGGTSLGFKNSQTINYANPASYISLDTLSFLFEGALLSTFTTQTSLSTSQSGNNSTLSYLLFGFPISKWWKTTVGLLPYSNVGYKITDTQHQDSLGTVNYIYEGQGGLNEVFIGNAFKITKGLSIGLNLGYLFGSIDKTRTVLFPDMVTAYNSRLKSSTEMSGFLMSFGTQYFKKLSEKYTLGIGITYSNAALINTRENYFVTSFTRSTSGYEYLKDTLENISGQKSSITIPASLGVGFSLKVGDKYEFGSDFKWQNWGKYTVNSSIDTLQNSWQLSAGCQILPSVSASNYFSKVFYRFGARYGKTYLNLKNQQLDEWAISAGLSLPFKKSKSTINFGIEYGQRGTTSDNLIRESFTRITLGVSINERWFVRRKFF